MLGDFEDVVEDGDADLGEVFDDQVAADPQHRDRADEPMTLKMWGMMRTMVRPMLSTGPGAVVLGLDGTLGQVEAEIVRLHEQSDEAVHEERHEERDPDEDGDAHRAVLIR